MTDEERIEKVLSEMESHGGMLDVQKFLKNTISDSDLTSYRRIKTVLLEIKAVKEIHNTTVLEILPMGREIVEKGGYIKYISDLKQKKDREDYLKQITVEDTEYKLRLNKFYFKYRWLPFVVSIIALVVSILVAFFK